MDASRPDHLRVGGLDACLDGADLRHLTVGDTPVLNRVHPTTRGPGWTTPSSEVERLEVTSGAAAFRLAADVRHRDDANDMRWTVVVEGTADGVTWRARGTALREQEVLRAGWSVLLPDAVAGAPYRAWTPRGPMRAWFPSDVLPQMPTTDDDHATMPRLDALELEIEDLTVRLAFHGALFELEDQRNWGDASFKAYPGPAATARPVTLAAGATVEQVVELGVRRRGAGRPARRRSAAIAVGGPGAELGPMPRWSSLTLADRPDRLLVVLRDGDDRGAADAAAAAARSAGLRVDLEIDAAAVRPQPGPLVEALASVRIFMSSGAVPSRASLERARAALALPAGIDLGVQAPSFVALNARRPDPAGLDVVAWGFHPQTHATDDRSVMETPAVLEAIGRTARLFSADCELVVSPLSFAPPDVADPRADGPVGRAWLAAAVIAAARAGVAGVVGGRVGRPTWSEPGDVALEARCSAPERVAALGLRRADGRRAIVLVNLTPEPLTVQAAGGHHRLAAYEVAVAEPA